MKFVCIHNKPKPRESLPPRGAWIEILSQILEVNAPGRSPHGERGLKWWRMAAPWATACRSPHGERGLKLYSVNTRSPR